MDHASLLLGLAVAFGFIMAWGVGANDVANAMGTSVGSKALTLRQAIIIAIIFELLGAFFAGGQVTDTIRSQIVDVSFFASDPIKLVFGMLASLLAGGTWLILASYQGWPVSTTHSIIGAVVGFACVCGDWHAIQWLKVGQIVLSWVGTPVMALVLAYLLFSSVQRLIFRSFRPVEQAKKHVLWYVFAVVYIIAYNLVTLGLERFYVLSPWLELSLPLAFSIFCSLGIYFTYSQSMISEGLRRRQQFAKVEQVFALLMIFTAAAMAFAHGSNDVANAVGPLAAVVDIVMTKGDVMAVGHVSSWVLGLGALGIVLGLTTWGYKVIATIGNNITQLTPSRGFAAQLATSSAVILASSLGMPVSTTHTMVGAVLGVGFTRGIGALNVRVVRSIFMSWVVTLPAGAVLAVVYYYILEFSFRSLGLS